ncbi:MAG TPA: M61 family peptidase [Fulvivirga sp.]|nr:M61 family peptidase [Fulvivirga sp.]
MKSLFTLFLLTIPFFIYAQINSYEISFENAAQHVAEIKATFPNIKSDTFSLRMSRSSPGRYAIHEFAKNVFNFKATDSKGNPLKVTRATPDQWGVLGHDGTVNISYSLFANHGDGTYAQVDETHAHLNIPATFMYAPAMPDRQIEVTFKPREDLNWKIATQLAYVSGTTYSAPNFQYFMDSPVEISDYSIREFEVESNGKKYNIRFVLHHNGTDGELDTYFDQVKKIVLTEKQIFGELPDYDFDTYTFLACYIPNASGDGMEHRNSTVLTSRHELATGGMERNIGTVSHEFFHSWNVERIRPKSLEPFNFADVNMSGELWFAEGFTEYYMNLVLCRAGIITPEKYVEGLARDFNYVWNSPARQFFNPIEMSYQAPFVDAATSIDPVNRENLFISYYSYGSMLGLALDLSLRQKNLSLDNFMQLMWEKYGKEEKPYTLYDLNQILNEYAGKDFGDHFFEHFIYKSEMPDYAFMFKAVGVTLTQNPNAPYFGTYVAIDYDGTGTIKRNPLMGSPSYNAGLDKGQTILSINNKALPKGISFNEYLNQFNVGYTLEVKLLANDQQKTTQVVLSSDPTYSIQMLEKEGEVPSELILKNRKSWLWTEE